MSDTEIKAIEVYATAISSLVAISAAGLAGSIALLQFSNSDIGNTWLHIIAVFCMSLALVFCFLTMAGLTGQVTSSSPSLFIPNVRYPSVAALILACAGFIFMGCGAWSYKSHSANSESLAKLTICRLIKEPEIKRKIMCYDSFVDSNLQNLKLTDDTLNKLPDKDKIWIKLLIQQILSERQ